jgi:hypothetical protein
MNCFYTSASLPSCFLLSVTDSKIKQRVSKFCIKLDKTATETLEIGGVLGERCLSRAAV